MACLCLAWRSKWMHTLRNIPSVGTAVKGSRCCIIPRSVFDKGITSFSSLPSYKTGFLPTQLARAISFQSKLLLRRRTHSPWIREFGKSSKKSKNDLSDKHKSVAMYTLSMVILVSGASYAAVPLYRLYCQSSGYGGTVQVTEVGEQIEKMEKQKQRPLTVKFNADKSATMQWNFKPKQSEIKIFPGETALAFYTASNPTDQAITGVSTYNVIPFEAGQYFNKIQCFCFEEQRLNPGEEVDMPVFFYIDPEFVDDPSLRKVTELTLSYTFFEAKDGSWPDLGVPQGSVSHANRST